MSVEIMKVSFSKPIDTTISIMKLDNVIDCYFSRRGSFVDEGIVHILTKNIQFSEIKMENYSSTIRFPYYGQEPNASYDNFDIFLNEYKFKNYNYLYKENLSTWYYINTQEKKLIPLLSCIKENIDKLNFELREEFEFYEKGLY